MILHYEGLSAINNIKYHDITLWAAISAINNIKYHDITI